MAPTNGNCAAREEWRSLESDDWRERVLTDVIVDLLAEIATRTWIVDVDGRTPEPLRKDAAVGCMSFPQLSSATQRPHQRPQGLRVSSA